MTVRNDPMHLLANAQRDAFKAELAALRAVAEAARTRGHDDRCNDTGDACLCGGSALKTALDNLDRVRGSDAAR